MTLRVRQTLKSAKTTAARFVMKLQLRRAPTHFLMKLRDSATHVKLRPRRIPKNKEQTARYRGLSRQRRCHGGAGGSSCTSTAGQLVRTWGIPRTMALLKTDRSNIEVVHL